MVRLCGKRQEPEPEQEPEWSLVTLQITLPSRLTGGLRPPRTSLAQMAAGAQSELTCAGLNAGWSRRASVAAWRCNIVAADPPMADGPLDNSAALRGNVAMIRTGGGVSVGDKAAQAVAAGVVGIIFVNAGGSEMIAPQLEKGRDPSALSHVPAICITTRVGEQLDKLLHSHQILNDLPAGSGYAPGENAIRIRWWDIAVGWSARRIQKRWKWLLSQRKLQGRLLQQDALLAEQANRLWQKTQEAAAAEAAARHLESKSVSKIAWRRRNPRHSLETISQQQHRLARQDAVLRARIAATGRAVAPLPRVAPAPGCPEKVRQREKRENASRTANMGAESGRQWVDSLPLAGVEKQHAELIEQRQRCASQSQERSQHERGISALQRELALARLARLTRGNTG